MQNNRKKKQFDSNLRKYTRTDRKYRTNKNNNKGQTANFIIIKRNTFDGKNFE